VLSGVSAALLAAVIGLLIIEAIALVVWMAEPRSSAPLSDALRTGAAFWLLGHGARLHLPAGSAGLIPLGLTVIFAALAARSGAAVARVRPDGPRRRTVAAAAAAVAVPYGLIAAAVAGVASSGGLRVSPIAAGAGAFVLALFGATVGASRELPMAVPKPTRWRALASGVTVAGGVLLAGAALIAAIALLTHLTDAAALAKPAKAGAVGGVGLLAIQASLAPNVIAWSASYLLGPGFAVGAGTLVSPGHTHLGDVPALPMLAALPSSAAAWPLYILFLIPIAAGVLGGIVVVRRLPQTPKLWTSALLGAGVGVGLALFMAAAAVLSGGPVTSGQLETVGPAALPVALMALLEIGVPSVLAAVGLSWRREQLRLRETGKAASVRGLRAGLRRRLTDGLRDAWDLLSDWRLLGRGIRRLPTAAWAALAAGVMAVVRAPGQGVHWVFHGTFKQPKRLVVPPAEPEPGRVSLVKPPHDPYELFRDSLNEDLDEEPNDASDETIVDLTDAALAAEDDFFDDDDDFDGQVDDQTDQEIDDELDDEMDGEGAAGTSATSKGRRLLVPKRLRRKPKVIKLPD
jgi:hypothetical protein